MSDDFFGVAKFPEASIKVNSVSTDSTGFATISGDLTIKGITHPFTTKDAAIRTEGSQIFLKGRVAVDRTLYDVRYGSAKFFADIADKAINDEFDITFYLTGVL
jgi:polyisoprenoid-binding protein YceI